MELLAVVLILGVISSIAAPLYVNTRKASAARACKYNIKLIASAQSAYALRFGTYCFDVASKGKKPKPSTHATTSTYVAPASLIAAPTGGLVGAPEGLAQAVYCPLDNGTYTCRQNGNVAPALDIQCPNRFTHADTAGVNSPSAWQCTLLSSQDGDR